MAGLFQGKACAFLRSELKRDMVLLFRSPQESENTGLG
jgi:hypothetical protein